MHRSDEKIPAIILAGGLGTRLRTLDPERPKPMVLVEGKPFLFWLIKHLQKAGFDYFILSVGYKAEMISDYDWPKDFPKSSFKVVHEEQALGTGGAVREVFESLKTLQWAWVFNGDTLLEHPLPPKKMNDAVHYVCLKPGDIFDAQPNLHVSNNKVIAVGEGGSLFDAGQVFVTREAVENYAGSIPCSFHQLVKKNLEEKNVGFTLTHGTCYDIGTPQRLARFSHFLSQSK